MWIRQHLNNKDINSVMDNNESKTDMDNNDINSTKETKTATLTLTAAKT